MKLIQKSFACNINDSNNKIKKIAVYIKILQELCYTKETKKEGLDTIKKMCFSRIM